MEKKAVWRRSLGPCRSHNTHKQLCGVFRALRLAVCAASPWLTLVPIASLSKGPWSWSTRRTRRCRHAANVNTEHRQTMTCQCANTHRGHGPAPLRQTVTSWMPFPRSPSRRPLSQRPYLTTTQSTVLRTKPIVLVKVIPRPLPCGLPPALQAPPDLVFTHTTLDPRGTA